MKILTLLRHAKSAWDGPAQCDFDRHLNARGHEAARAIGREMDKLGLRFDSVVASPAIRVVETLAGVAETYGHLDPSFDDRLYLAPAATLLKIVHETDEEFERLLIVGHNPGMERLASLLARQDALHGQAALKFPTGVLAEIRFAAETWDGIASDTGTLARFIRPRDLDPALGPEPD